MRLMLLFVIALGLVAGCSERNKNRHAFDGVYFKAKAKRVDKSDYSTFTLAVSPVSQSLDGAREAARFEGTRYCIDTDGTSRIRWLVGPDSDASAFTIDKDTIVFQGTCDP